LNAPDSDPENDLPNPDVVKRRVKVRGQWQTQRMYRPQIVSDYNNFMGGVDLCDQMTNMNKSKKQMHWYMRVFVKFLLIACFNAYIMEGQVIDHDGRGKRKRDLLQFKQDLCIQLVGDTLGKNSKRRRQDVPSLDRLEHVGVHLPVKGEGHNHRCVVCERKFTEAKTRRHIISRHKTSYMCQHCNVYQCIGPPGESCVVDYHSRVVYWQ